MNHLALGVFLAGMLLGGTISASAATLWDLLIKVEFEQAKISVGDRPVIFGSVMNQASKPVAGAEVKIRFAGTVATITTDQKGSFRYEFGEQHSPGTFSVSVSAKSNNLKGFSTTAIKIGDQPSTFGDLYYGSLPENRTSMDSLSGDPYKALKLKHYQKFLEEQHKRKIKQGHIEAENIEMAEKRDIARQKLELALKERPVGSGKYEGDAYEEYVAKLDPRIKGTISGQLNYTKRIFEEAQYAMKTVLDNGGSLQEARKAYLEKLSTTKEELVAIGDYNNTENHSKVKKAEDAKINSKKVKGLKLNKYLK